MRQLLVTILFCGLFAQAALAETVDASIYVVTDVVADVAADSAAHARDKAIAQAQHLAFDQLLDRLGADKSVGTKLSDDDLSTLVQHFELQNEKSSAVRYVGTFTVQFRPNAVRKLLGAKNVHFTDTRSKPFLILPILYSKTRPILWEETTAWRSAWDSAAHNTSGLVPLIAPSGDLDDISALSAEEAVNGKAEALAVLIDKYHAGGAVVASLHADPEAGAAAPTVEVQSYDDAGSVINNAQVTVTMPAAAKTGADDIVTQAVKQTRALLEKNWRQTVTATPTANNPGPAGESSVVTSGRNSAALTGSTLQLPVLVPIAKLADLAKIKQALNSVDTVTRVDVISMARGGANIQIIFHGTLPDLQNALLAKRMTLSQDLLSGNWMLHIAGLNDSN